MAKTAGALAKAERRFGVDRYVLAAIWGVESNFGQDMGERPLVQSLSTLACFERAAAELFSRRADGDAENRRSRRHPARASSTAPGRAPSGRRNSCPRHFCALAVDLDGSGARHRRQSAAAALGSTANFLKHAGWRDGRALGLRGENSPRLCRPLGPQDEAADVGLGGARRHARRRPPARGGRSRPAAARRAPTARRFSSRAISMRSAATTPPSPMRWRSASWPQRLAGGPGIVTPWPTDDPGLSRAERRELQRLLSRHGYDVGEPDGAIGAKTRAADRRFRGQDRHGRRRAGVGEGAGGAEEVDIWSGCRWVRSVMARSAVTEETPPPTSWRRTSKPRGFGNKRLP